MKINRIDQKTAEIQYVCMKDINSDLYYDYEYTYMHTTCNHPNNNNRVSGTFK